MTLKKTIILALGCICSLSIFGMDNDPFFKKRDNDNILDQGSLQKKHRSHDRLIIENNEITNDSEEVDKIQIEEAKNFAEAVRFILPKNDQRKVILLSDFHGVITKERTPESGKKVHWAEHSENAIEKVSRNPKIEMIISTAWNKIKDIIDNFNDLSINCNTFHVTQPSREKKISILQEQINTTLKNLDKNKYDECLLKNSLYKDLQIFKEMIPLNEENSDFWMEEFLFNLDKKYQENNHNFNFLQTYMRAINQNLSEHRLYFTEDFKQNNNVKIAGKTFSFNFFGNMVSVRDNYDSKSRFFRDKGISLLSLTNPHLRPDYNGLRLDGYINKISSKEYSEIFFMDDSSQNIKNFILNIEWLQKENLLDKGIKVTPVLINPNTNKIHFSFSLDMKNYHPEEHCYEIKNDKGEIIEEPVQWNHFIFKENISGRTIGKLNHPEGVRYAITNKFTIDRKNTYLQKQLENLNLTMGEWEKKDPELFERFMKVNNINMPLFLESLQKKIKNGEIKSSLSKQDEVEVFLEEVSKYWNEFCQTLECKKEVKRFNPLENYRLYKREKLSIMAIYKKVDGTEEKIACFSDVDSQESFVEESRSFRISFFGRKGWLPRAKIHQKPYTANTYYKLVSDCWLNTPEWTHNEEVFQEARNKCCPDDLQASYASIEHEDIDENVSMAQNNLGSGKIELIAYYCSNIRKIDGFRTINDPLFDGTRKVSRIKYAYALIAFFESKGVLPRQQCFRQVVLEYLGLDPADFDKSGRPKQDLDKEDK